MFELPKLHGLILCDRAHVNRENGEFSLVGLFQTRRFPEFPTPPVGFTVYAALFEGAGEGTLELKVELFDTGRVIYKYQRWLVNPPRGLTMHLEIRIKRCVFPTPGLYDLILRFDGKELGHRFLDVYQD